jgi:peptidoglycan/xylan/chitin deacetylase (PgdA/CDA1 family)
VVKGAAAVGDRVRRPARGVVILLYHRVGGRSGSEIDLPVSLFDEQMAWLAAESSPSTIDDALAALDRPEPADGAPDPVVVTFDDGTADLVDLALPILVRHRIPAVFYLATDFIESGREFPDRGRPLSWTGVAEAAASGLVTIGSHTHTHALLDRVEVEAAADELDRSRDLVAEHVGRPAGDFAYPKAVLASPPVEHLVRSRFRSAALGGNRPNPYGRTDRHRLTRSAIQRSDGMRYFERKATGGMALEEWARRALNRVRYSRSST